jgi:dTDP-glucose 4,6-dehydratase
MTKKIVIIGANSFSGQNFVDLLLDDERNRVIGVSRSPERSSLFLQYKLHPFITHYHYEQIDLNKNISRLLSLLDAEKPQYVVNFASQSEVAPSWDAPGQWFKTNTVALAHLVNHLRKQSYLERYLQISTCEVYGHCQGRVSEDTKLHPTTPYAASKAAADMLLDVYRRQFSFPLLTVRSTNVYGARQQLHKIIPRSAIYLRLNKKIELHGGGVAEKSYIHIRDVARGYLAILERGRIGEVYHLSPDDPISIRHLVGSICTLRGDNFDKAVHIVRERPGQDAAYILDSAKARNELKWKPEVTLEQGLREVVEWIDEYWEEIQEQPLEYEHKP